MSAHSGVRVVALALFVLLPAFREGRLNGRRVVVGRSGAGKVNAAIIITLLIGRFKPLAILFSGTAGAIDPALFPGDVVIGKTVAQY